MSEENVELARKAFRAFNQRDRDALLALMDKRVVAESRLAAMEGGYQGHEGIRRWWMDLLSVFPDYTVEIQEMRDFGDAVLTRFQARGAGADSGTPCARSGLAPDEVARRKVRVVESLLERKGSPRSRRAVGVGDLTILEIARALDRSVRWRSSAQTW